MENKYLSKYRTIDDAIENEMETIRCIVKNDKEYRPTYHIYPKTGLLNDPNGLVFDGEKYHIFYQWYPFDSKHGMKHWVHITTKDFIEFEECNTIIPKEKFETHGCYSGGGLVIGDSIYCFYTGNTKQGEDLKRVSYQNIAIVDKNSSKIKYKYPISKTPKGFTEHFRDPKPWIEEDKIKFVCGAQREDETGTAAIFSYDDDKKSSKYLGELEVEGFNNENVFMWECPDLLTIDNKDLFLWCPQGIKPSKNKFRNIYSATYAIGKREGHKFSISNWDELDRGFDFYAPQTIAHDKDSIIIGWIGLPDAKYPADEYKWQGALSMTRTLHIVEDKLYQQPHKSIYMLMDIQKKENIISGKNNVEFNVSTSYISGDINNKEFVIDLFVDNNTKLSLSYEGGYFTIDRSNTIQTDFMMDYGSERKIKLSMLKNIEIFIDNSIIEVFLNDGEYVLTSRFFIENKSNIVNIEGDISLILYEMKGIKLWEE